MNRLLAIMILLLSCTLFSCKKTNSSTTKVTYTTDFTWSGVLIAGDSIHFLSNGGGSLHWDFGDTTVSSELNPYHIYHHSGSFNVVLVVNGSTVANKIITITADPIYTYLIAGVRNWHHVDTSIEIGTPSVITNYPDASFEVTYIDPLTIAIGTDTLTYWSTSDDSVLNFDHTYYADGIHPTGSYDKVHFNRLSSAITFRKYSHITAAASLIELYTTF